MIISKLANFIKNVFYKKPKRQNFLEPDSAKKRNAEIRRLREANLKKCSKCGKNSSEATLEYDPVEKQYICADCWKEEV